MNSLTDEMVGLHIAKISERSSETLTARFPLAATLLLRVTALLFFPFLHKEFSTIWHKETRI
jgi:hypothetical protein